MSKNKIIKFFGFDNVFLNNKVTLLGRDTLVAVQNEVGVVLLRFLLCCIKIVHDSATLDS